jgi:hypothetical protein
VYSFPLHIRGCIYPELLINPSLVPRKSQRLFLAFEILSIKPDKSITNLTTKEWPCNFHIATCRMSGFPTIDEKPEASLLLLNLLSWAYALYEGIRNPPKHKETSRRSMKLSKDRKTQPTPNPPRPPSIVTPASTVDINLDTAPNTQLKIASSAYNGLEHQQKRFTPPANNLHRYRHIATISDT